VAQRSDLKAEANRWPERALPGFKDTRDLATLWPQLAMAHTDCTSCHHDLLHESWRQIRGYSGKPGRPPLAEWPFALTQRGLGLGDPEDRRAFVATFQSVETACMARPFGDPAALAKTAGAAAEQAQKRAERLDVAKTNPQNLLRELATLPPEAYPNFDSARQLMAALRVIHEESLRGRKHHAEDAALARGLDDWAAKLGLDSQRRLAERRAQQTLVIQVLGKVARKSGSPAYRTDVAFLDALDDYLRTGQRPKDVSLAEALERLLGALAQHGGDLLTRAIVAETALRGDLERAEDESLRQSLRNAREYDPRQLKQFLKDVAAQLATTGQSR
jgi:hypothetical protein